MRIAIFGSGGIGGYFGGRLAQSIEDVHFIARGEHHKALHNSGLRVDSILGDFTIYPVSVTDDPRKIGPVDWVLVCVKAWQTPDAALAISPLVDENSGVVFLGNGVDAPAQLAAVLGKQQIVGGLCKISANQAAPGYIRHVGIEPQIVIGEFDRRLSQRVENLRQAFAQAGVKVTIAEDIQVAIWEKFVFIAAVSGVGAVANAPIGVIRTVPETRQMLEAAIEEVVQVGRARGVRLPAQITANTLSFIDSIAPEVIPSMQRDIKQRRPSELASQSGAVVRIGLEAGHPTPTHQFIYHSLLPQELRARGEISWNSE
jgi:2-dehydropantoate 2-reductase